MKTFFQFFLPALTWFVLSIVLLTLPGSAFPKEDWLDKIWIDKWIHIGMFAIMVVLICRWLIKSISIDNKKRDFLICAVACLGYGIVMEFVQKYYIPNRSFDVVDILADGTGSFLGAWYAIKAYIKK